ncbi:MAG: hypothetical protein U0167_02865 [bacterium]
MRSTLPWLVLVLGCATPARADVGSWAEGHVHGFVSQGLLSSTKNNYLNESRGGDLSFTEIGVNAFADLRPGLSIGGQLFTRDLGPLGNYDVKLDWAFLDWRVRNEFGLRLGAYKLPYGLYSETADVDAVRTPILLPQSIYNLQFRDFQTSSTGGDAHGSIAIPAGLLSYELHFGWTTLKSDGSIARTLDDFGSGAWTVDDVDPIPGVGTALIWEQPSSHVRAGLTFQRYLNGNVPIRINPLMLPPGEPTESAWTFDQFDMQVASVEYTPGLWTLVAEYGQWNGILGNARFPINVTDERYYVQVARELRSNLAMSTYYSVYYPDRGDRDGAAYADPNLGYSKDFALSLRVDLTSRLIAKIEGHDVHGTASLSRALNPLGMQPRWQYLATKLSVAF